MKKKLLILLAMVICCFPMLTLAEKLESVRIDDMLLEDDECYKGVCLDEDTNTITIDNTNNIFPAISSFDNLRIEIKNNVVLDFDEEGSSDFKFNNITGKLTLYIEENSSLTIKNSPYGLPIHGMEEVEITGAKTGSLIFENTERGITTGEAKVTISNITIEAKDPIFYILMADNEEQYPVTIKNANIKANRLEGSFANGYNRGEERSLIGISNADLKIIDSTITSSYAESADGMPSPYYAIYTGTNLEITNSNIDLKNYGYGLSGFDKATINSSNIKLENCIYGIDSNEVIFESGVLKVLNTFKVDEELGIKYPVVGISSEGKIDIRNGYLEFGKDARPFGLMDVVDFTSTKNDRLIISDKLAANKKYVKSVIRVIDGSSYSLMLTKEGTAEAIDVTEENSLELLDDLLDDVIFKGKTKVHFDAGDGTGKMNDVEADYLTDKLPENKLTAPEGKRFKGWSTSKDGEIITKLTNTDEVTLYPVWEDIPKEEKKEKENPNTGAIISLAIVGSMLSIGGCLYYRTNKSSKFN